MTGMIVCTFDRCSLQQELSVLCVLYDTKYGRLGAYIYGNFVSLWMETLLLPRFISHNRPIITKKRKNERKSLICHYLDDFTMVHCLAYFSLCVPISLVPSGKIFMVLYGSCILFI